MCVIEGAFLSLWCGSSVICSLRCTPQWLQRVKTQTGWHLDVPDGWKQPDASHCFPNTPLSSLSLSLSLSLSSFPSIFNTRLQERSTLTSLITITLITTGRDCCRLVKLLLTPHGSQWQSHRTSRAPSPYTSWYVGFLFLVIPKGKKVWKRLLSSPFVPIYILRFIIYFWYYFKCLFGLGLF